MALRRMTEDLTFRRRDELFARTRARVKKRWLQHRHRQHFRSVEDPVESNENRGGIAMTKIADESCFPGYDSLLQGRDGGEGGLHC